MRRRFSTFGGWSRDPYAADLGPIGRPRRRWLTRLVVGIVVCAVAVLGIVVATHRSSGDAAADVPLPTPQPRPSAPAVVPGWVAVTDSGASIAYDVPADWKVSYVGDGQTLSNGRWSLVMTMMSSYLDGYCESNLTSFRAQAGAATVPDANGTTAATDTARQVATALYGPVDSGAGAPPTVTIGRPTAASDHGLTGTLVTARVTVNKPDRCEPPTALVDVFALPNPAKHESLVVVAYADQQFTGAVKPQDLDTIVTSFRRLPTK
jgi:hypothetical protein